MTANTSSDFGPIRSCLWPIYRQEWEKLFPMLIMLFLTCFNYSILRNLKDTLVVTAKSSGAEVIPFIKVWVMLPAAVLTTVIFTKLSNRIRKDRLYYLIISFFLAYFFAFTFFIYTSRDALHPHQTADFLESILPAGFKGLVAMYRNWTLTVFYVMSELWGSLVLTVLFWGFANEVTRLSEATRFYSVMSIASNFAAIVAGQTAVYFSETEYNPHFIVGSDAWEQTMVKLISLILISGLGILCAFRWMTQKVLKNDEYDFCKPIPKKKKRLSFKESLVYLAHSKYLICIAAIVVAYNLVINLVEIIWKDQLRQLCPAPSDYNLYMNNLTTAMGVVSTVTSLLMAGMLKRLGWTKTALITPIIMLLTCTGFFGFMFTSKYSPDFLTAVLGTTPLAIAVFFGSLQNCFSKAAKYSVFDATKEMAFIPLSTDHKLKGKAAIDGIGSRLGKSGGSLIHQGLLVLFGTLTNSAPWVAACLLVVIVIWIMAVRSLGIQFKAISEGHPEVVGEETDPHAIDTAEIHPPQEAHLVPEAK